MQCSIEENIESDIQYVWAKNPIQAQRFKTVTEQVDTALDKDKFNTFLIRNDAQFLSKKFGDDLPACFKNFVAAMEPAVNSWKTSRNALTACTLRTCNPDARSVGVT